MSSEQNDMSGQPSEEEMRAAYEAELNRITSGEMILQTAVSLLNIGGRRLGLGSPPGQAESERDLEQVADAIDGARALMPILERRMPGGELKPLRDAISQLQMAYAREVQSAREAPSSTTTTQPPPQPSTPQEPGSTAQPASAEKPSEAPTEEDQQGPGPAQASGRLWVPGR